MIHHGERLELVDPRLVQVVEATGQQREILVVEGARSYEDEVKAIATGHSSLKDPMHSKHVIRPGDRPLALAVDLSPYPVQWEDIGAFKELANAMKVQAEFLKIPIVWGGDWVTFKDWDHFELGAA